MSLSADAVSLLIANASARVAQQRSVGQRSFMPTVPQLTRIQLREQQQRAAQQTACTARAARVSQRRAEAVQPRIGALSALYTMYGFEPPALLPGNIFIDFDQKRRRLPSTPYGFEVLEKRVEKQAALEDLRIRREHPPISLFDDIMSRTRYSTRLLFNSHPTITASMGVGNQLKQVLRFYSSSNGHDERDDYMGMIVNATRERFWEEIQKISTPRVKFQIIIHANVVNGGSIEAHEAIKVVADPLPAAEVESRLRGNVLHPAISQIYWRPMNMTTIWKNQREAFDTIYDTLIDKVSGWAVDQTK